jgi:CrcB protein
MKLYKQRDIFARDTHPELPIDPDVVRPGEYRWPPHFTPVLLGTVFVGGFAGALARYGVITIWPTASNSFPIATLFVNLLGAFLLGLLLEGLSRRGRDDGLLRIIRLLIGTGFMGAFTTYSTFAVETNQLIRHGSVVVALLYIASSIIGGLLLCAVGIKIAAVYHTREAGQK